MWIPECCSTNGEDVSVHDLDEDAVALWRGQTLGVVFQSFQLLSTPENVTIFKLLSALVLITC